MPRRKKIRCVSHMPDCTYFKPAGIPTRHLEEIVLKVEEMEAIRLKDLLGLEQVECASRMKISRPTFQRILAEARNKVATVLVEGKALRIEGGSFDYAGQVRICPYCDFGRIGMHAEKCPKCDNPLDRYKSD